MKHQQIEPGIEELAASSLNPPRQTQQAQQQQQQYAGGNVLSPIAMASVDGSATPVFLRQRGFNNTIARTGAGIYVLTLLNAIDLAGGNGVIYGGINGATAVGATVQFSPTTASTITVTLATLTAVPAAAAADLDFWIVVQPIGSN